ncbi:MAG: GNAT family N-acetyltransferase, partial [Gammaproteobacteria bacterium]|nr:GNAT family N-acetyltransferase [Gammaproteobacteria bacterium]
VVELMQRVAELGMNGLLVKAQADAVGFFSSHGFSHLPVTDQRRDYPHRWWREV